MGTTKYKIAVVDWTISIIQWLDFIIQEMKQKAYLMLVLQVINMEVNKTNIIITLITKCNKQTKAIYFLIWAKIWWKLRMFNWLINFKQGLMMLFSGKQLEISLNLHLIRHQIPNQLIISWVHINKLFRIGKQIKRHIAWKISLGSITFNL